MPNKDSSLGGVLIAMLAVALFSSCGHHKQARVSPPSPPGAEEPSATEPGAPSSQPEGAVKNDRLPGAEGNGAEIAEPAEPTLPSKAEPQATETRFASWYGSPF